MEQVEAPLRDGRFQQAGHLSPQGFQVAVFPAGALTRRGFFIRGQQPQDLGRGGELGGVARDRQIDAELHIFDDIAAGQGHRLDARPGKGHSRPRQGAGSGHLRQPQGANPVFHQKREGGDGVFHGGIGGGFHQVEGLDGISRLSGFSGDRRDRPRFHPAVRVHHHHHVRRILSQVPQAVVEGVSFPPVVPILAFEHRRAFVAGDGCRFVGAVVGDDDRLVRFFQLGQDPGQCRPDHQRFIVGRNQYRNPRFR